MKGFVTQLVRLALTVQFYAQGRPVRTNCPNQGNRPLDATHTSSMPYRVIEFPELGFAKLFCRACKWVRLVRLGQPMPAHP